MVHSSKIITIMIRMPQFLIKTNVILMMAMMKVIMMTTMMMLTMTTMNKMIVILPMILKVMKLMIC